MLAIASYATKSYLHAWPQCIRSITAAANHIHNAHFIFATDDSEEADRASLLAQAELPNGWQFTKIALNVDDQNKEKYKQQSQFLIASLQGAAFNFARKIRADQLWSVESDMLVPPDALKISEWVLKMPQADGTPYYDIAACTYPNGAFLGGFGSYEHYINEDFLPEERKIPDKFKKIYNIRKERIKDYEEKLKKITLNKNLNNVEESFLHVKNSLEKEVRRFQKLREKIKNYPPDGNIWDVISKYGWRKRGWMDYAYPGIGKGSIVPSDWCGLGCTLLSKKALALADYSGYEGLGTQDLYLCWRRWNPANLRIACVPHVVCDHIKHKKDEPNKNTCTHYVAYHETDPNFAGHLRVRYQDWIPL